MKNLKYMDPDLTINITTGPGEGEIVWKGVNDNWQIAAEPELHEMALSNSSSYFLDFIQGGSGQGDGTIAYGLCNVEVGSYKIHLDWRDDDLLSGTATGYSTHTWHIRWDGSQFEQELLDHTWPDIGDGDTVAIWGDGRKSPGVPSRNRLQPTVPANLTLSNSGVGPKLTWDASYPSEYATIT